MQGKPKVDDEKYRIEIEITESPEFKVRTSLQIHFLWTHCNNYSEAFEIKQCTAF